MNWEQSQQYIASFRALSDINRLRILQLLCAGERCACDLLRELDITQPTLSHHMRALCGCGLVAGRKEGRWMHYTLAPGGEAHYLEFWRTLREEHKAEEYYGR